MARFIKPVKGTYLKHKHHKPHPKTKYTKQKQSHHKDKPQNTLLLKNHNTPL
jgi:hypothetical protein